MTSSSGTGRRPPRHHERGIDSESLLGKEIEQASPERGVARLGGLEGAVISLPGQAPHDDALAERVVCGVLGIESSA